jgi:hypothetical protein
MELMKTNYFSIYHHFFDNSNLYLPKFIFTVFRVIESFMDGMVKEQRLRTKNVNAKKVNTAKTQADRSCKNLLVQFSHLLHLHGAQFTFY